MKVLKFGGSSVGTPDAIKNVVEIVSSQKEDRLVVVVSAFRGVTDQLIKMAELAARADEGYTEILREIEQRHFDTIKSILSPKCQSDTITRFKIIFNELEDVLQGVSLIHELTPKTLDFIVGFGERFSALVLAACLEQKEIPALFTDTRRLIKTDNNYGSARVLVAQTYQNIKNHLKQNSENVIVATGFIASTEKNESTTLGRGGSDYTASIFGSALSADAIEIWTDVDGLMTADPRKVKRAFSVENASYEEAMELSHFGARVIYPPTIQPALKSGIPIVIKNTFRPEHPGTMIKKEIKAKPGLIRGISSIDDVSLITIRGSGMIGVSGVASRIFSALARKKINIILITQSSSEHTVSLAVLPDQAGIARKSIEEEFSYELKNDIIDEIKIEKDLSIIAVVGDNMRQIPGIAGRVFNALGRNGINIVAIAQGSSERNISFVVEKKNERKAMNTLHDAFFLSGVKTVNLFLVGVGLIGGTLLKLISEQAEVLYKEYQIDVNLKGVANSRQMLLNEDSVSLQGWEEELNKQGKEMVLENFVEEMKEMNLPNCIFIDCTASSDLPQVYEDILSQSISIVTPNKKANSSGQEFFNSLHRTAERHNCAFQYETNVGAGLPIIATIHELVTTGDSVERIEGVLSGTLSYIFNSFEGGTSFSEIVKTAREKGYTEPDPREDLNGQDVGRKLLILARVAGFELEFNDVEIQSLVPHKAGNAKNADDFLEQLKAYDKEFEDLRKQAEEEGKKLCYIARFEKGRAMVKMEKISENHPFYNLSGSDNIIALFTRHYSENPMVIKGPGAGASVTAGGIIADILRVTNTKVYSNAGS
ncbi:MAG: bifunctional aspartate kinase/homoserine dehydrogenase I [Balneolaceae bacterium]